MILLAGGGRALFMQAAHPMIAAGVADHSRFLHDPLGRLRRTMNAVWSVVFDSKVEALLSLERVKAVHARVKGTVRGGEGGFAHKPYDAGDPRLLLWVHATLVDTAMLSYETFVAPMTPEERARYYEETRQFALLFDVPEQLIPPTLDDFRAYMDSMIRGEELFVGPTARAIADDILHPRPWLFRPAAPLFSFVTAGLLPERLRRNFGLEWGPEKERRLRRLAAVTRRLLPFVPRVLRVVPHARSAEKTLGVTRKAKGKKAGLGAR